MKKITLTLLAVGLIASTLTATAGTTIIAGTGINIAANTTSNLAANVVVGQFVLSPQTLTQSYNAGPTPGQITVMARLTFDGTNFYTIPTTWTNATAGATNATWVLATTYYPVSGSLSVSNAMSQPLTNYQAILSN